MSKQASAFPLRMPDGMREWFDAAARESGRSLNSELIQSLKEFQAQKTALHPEAQQPGL